MKKKGTSKFYEWASAGPVLSVSEITVPSNAFKEKMEEGERILKIAGVPKRPKK